MTWMTPLLVWMSAFTTFAPSMRTDPSAALIETDCPLTVLALFSFTTCEELTEPGTTW